jgi:hypothetical protein
MALGGTGGFLPKTPPPTSENQLFPGPGELGLTLSKWREQTLGSSSLAPGPSRLAWKRGFSRVKRQNTRHLFTLAGLKFSSEIPLTATPSPKYTVHLFKLQT